MKRKLFLPMFLIAIAVSMLCFSVNAEEVAPKVGVYGYNLIFDDQVSIEYAVTVKNTSETAKLNVGMLVWKEKTATHTPETADADIKPVRTDTIEGVDCYVLKYTDLSAKEMTDKVFSQPYVKCDGKITRGDIVEYSVCTYAERKLGFVNGVEGTKDESLKKLIRDMLYYGASSQIHFDYKTDCLATDILNDRIKLTYENMEDIENPNPARLEYEAGKYKLKNPVKKGYTFKYWCDVDNEWAPITEIDTSTAKTYNLAAVWEINQYTITYKNTKGLIQEGDLRFNYTYTVEDSINPEALEKYDYKFNGWRIGGAYGDFVGEDGIDAGTTGDIVLYADWTLKPEFKGFDYVVDDNYFLPDGQNFCMLTGVTTNDMTKLEISTVFNHIQAGALKYCSQLEELTLPFLGSDYTGTAGSYLGYVFGAETALGQNSNIPQSLKKITVNGSGRIGINAFRDCVSLTDIVVSGTSCDIGQNAYLGCTSLVSLTTPVYYNDAMKYSGSSKFCTYMTDYYYGIPGSFDRKNNTGSWESEYNLDIPRYNFETLHINGGEIGNRAFGNNLGIKHLIIDGIDVIRTYAFTTLKNMETLELHEGLIQIQDSAFIRCNNKNFNELIIPNSVTKLGGCDYVRMADDGNVWYEGPAEASEFREGPFQFCGYLSKIVIGDGVEAIPSACFNRTNVSPTPELELTLGKNVRMIGPLAFYGTAGSLNDTDCRISKLINNSVHKELIVYAHASSREDIGMITLLDAFDNCDNPPEKIYLGNMYKESYDSEKEYNGLEWNGMTVEKALSYTKFEIVVYSYYNPYENGKAVDGLTYWHGTDPYFWITKQYDTPVLWEKP